MIRIRFFQDEAGRQAGFEASGHALFVEEGPDIVCAGVSALLQTAVLGLQRCAQARPRYRRLKGHLRCEVAVRHRSQASDVLLGSILLGLGEIASRYPGYISIEQGLRPEVETASRKKALKEIGCKEVP